MRPQSKGFDSTVEGDEDVDEPGVDGDNPIGEGSSLLQPLQPLPRLRAEADPCNRNYS